jgi:hypothetical protein
VVLTKENWSRWWLLQRDWELNTTSNIEGESNKING